MFEGTNAGASSWAAIALASFSAASCGSSHRPFDACLRASSEPPSAHPFFYPGGYPHRCHSSSLRLRTYFTFVVGRWGQDGGQSPANKPKPARNRLGGGLGHRPL